MRIENPAITTSRFIPLWEGKHPSRITAEMVSVSQETNRRPDTYHFEFNEKGQLIDPETKEPILDIILPGVEYEIAEKLQTWGNSNSEGLAYWISPPSDSRKYPCAKIIVHRIAYMPKDGEMKKAILNSAILFDAELESPEELRKTFLTTQDSEEEMQNILTWVEKVSKKKINTETNQQQTREQAENFTKMVIAGINHRTIIEEMQRLGFLGQHSISCAGGVSTFTNVVLNNSSLLVENKRILCCTCPYCNKQVEAEIYGGKIHCPKCNAEAPWS